MIAALHRKLLRDLWRLRGQVVSTAAVVACGVMLVVAMYGTRRSLQHARDDYYTRARFGHVFAGATRVPLPVATRLAAIPGVTVVDPRVTGFASLDVPGLDLPAGGRVVSLPDDAGAGLDRLHLVSGRRARPHAVDEAVVSAGFARANALGVGDSIGAVLEGRWRRVQVVGIAIAPRFIWELSAAPGYTADERAFGVLWLARDAAESALGLRGAFNDIMLGLAPGVDPAPVIAAVDSILAPYGGTGAVARERQPSHAILEGEFRQLRVFGLMLPLIFLAVAAFLLNVVLGRLVATQRIEIAALKAFGYTDREVAGHFLAFAGAVVLVGSIAGVALGVWLGGLYTGLYANVLRFPAIAFALDPVSALGAIVASGAAALAGAWVAVRGAASLAPAEALRGESPERYRPLLLERLGVVRALPSALRMVLRHVEHRPARAASTSIGVAMALALLSGTLALFAAAFHMADVQFRVAQREDVAVSFDRPRPPDAARELTRLPGVLVTESFRIVPVRVRRGTVVRTTAITGMPPGGALHRLVDQEGRVHAVPPSGAVVGAAFAARLGVHVGDSLRIELLERGGEPRAVPVVALLDELFGRNIYMAADALDRLVGDGGRVSGAWLRIDPQREPTLLAGLKRVPAVTGASSRHALVAAWDRQMLEGLRVSGTLVVVCAVVIALGAVYNGARIALSERARELASLRVLGFTRREVALLLLGEQGALVAVALPIGLVGGAGLTTLLTRAFQSEDQRFPVLISPMLNAGAALVVVAAAVLAAALMRRRLDRLDLVAVLKTRE